MAKQERAVRIEFVEDAMPLDDALTALAKVIAREMYHQEQQRKGDAADGEKG